VVNAVASFAARPAPLTPGGRIDDQAGGIDQPRIDQRLARQDRRRRVASRRRDAGRAPNRVACDLGNAVGEAGQEFGRFGRFPVPACIIIRVAQPEIRAQVDERHAARDDGRGDTLRRAVGQRREHQVALVQQVSVERLDPLLRVGNRQMRMHVAHGVARAAVADQRTGAQRRVRVQQPQQLAADVPRRAQDQNRNHM
jgi:hypothetical protein